MFEHVGRETPRGARRTVVGVLAVAVVADLATTATGFRVGLTEANPAGRALLASLGAYALPAAKLAAFAALVALSELCHRRYGRPEQRAALAGCLIVAAVWLLAAIWNAALIVALTGGLT